MSPILVSACRRIGVSAYRRIIRVATLPWIQISARSEFASRRHTHTRIGHDAKHIPPAGEQPMNISIPDYASPKHPSAAELRRKVAVPFDDT